MKFLILSVMAALMLAGCGRRGAPTPPGPASAILYPHTYPSQ